MNNSTVQEFVVLKALLFPAITLAAMLMLSFAARFFLLRRLEVLTGRTKTQLDDIVLSSVRTPSVLWCLILSLYCTVYLSELPPQWIYVMTKILLVMAIVSVTFVVAGIVSRLITRYTSNANVPYRFSSFSKNIISAAIIVTGLLFILSSLGVSITPFLATLGVGGIAVALGLQETLASLFAGFYIIAGRQVRVGDYVKLESGQEGYVEDINWRATKIRMLANNIILIPNSKLAQTTITNCYFPDKELAVLVEVGVHYDSDLVHVERVTVETAVEIMKSVPGGIPEFKPFIRYHTFGDFSIGFTVIMRAKEFVDQYLIKHEFVKALHKRYRDENIIIPYPIRAINCQQEKSGGCDHVDKGHASEFHQRKTV